MTTVLALVSCSSSAGPGSASGGSPGAAVSSATPAADASVDAHAQASASQAALYAEAEGVYRAFFADYQEILVRGGVMELPSEDARYLMQEYYESVQAILRKLHDLGYKSKPGTAVVLSELAPYPFETRDGSLVTLGVCVDNSGSPLVDAEGNEYTGKIDFHVVFLKHDTDGLLKIFDGHAREVDQCPVS
ncbi:hypothetical protein [Propionibacterium sp.]|uniref:hypothetical protein n=1 Tax=Propionibacterium sp. TaxID=1977903 RepID=UPI0039EBAD16